MTDNLKFKRGTIYENKNDNLHNCKDKGNFVNSKD